MNYRQITLSALLGLSLLLCLQSCECDKPLEPRPAKDYIFYFNDASYFDQYYRYFSATAKVDSLTLPYGSRSGFAVSADGTRLYLADGAKTTVLSTDSLNVITTINYNSGGGVAVSPDNQLVTVQGSDGLYILATSDYSLVHHDTSVVGGVVFSRDSRNLYAAGWLHGVYRLDLSDPTFPIARKTFPYAVWKVLSSVDETKWFLLVKYDDCLWSFEVYEKALDSIIFRDTLHFNGYGDMVLSLNARQIFYTMPGTIELCPPDSPARLTVFDIDRNQINRRIMIPSPVNGVLLSQNLAISPDGLKLITDGAPGQGEFAVINVTTMKIADYYYLGNEVDIWDVTCQSAP